MTGFLDTNVLIYAVGNMPEEADKRERAWRLIDGGDVAVSMQVLQEFYHQVTRPSRSNALPPEVAKGFVQQWRRFPVQATTLALLDSGFELQARHRFSFWDSMIVAAARAQGSEVLWTEDMDDGRIVDGMRIANPFR